ncbi:MAG: hypothetical protein ACKVOW_07020 [Chitinophagaceae bacterium]
MRHVQVPPHPACAGRPNPLPADAGRALAERGLEPALQKAFNNIKMILAGQQ